MKENILNNFLDPIAKVWGSKNSPQFSVGLSQSQKNKEKKLIYALFIDKEIKKGDERNEKYKKKLDNKY